MTKKLTVVVPKGLKVLDKPMSETYGAKVLYTVPCGTIKTVYATVHVNTVPYALVHPEKQEYVRTDGYCELYDTQDDIVAMVDIAKALDRIANALEAK